MGYRDDTKILASGKKPQDIILSITTFAKAACPRRIPISFEYSVFIQSFLGCCFFCNFAGRSFSTYPRLNFTRPSKVVHPTSNTWKPQLFSGFIANMVDYSRICSESSTLSCVLTLLQDELLSAGHDKDSIEIFTKRAKSAIASAVIKDTDKYENTFHTHEINYPPGAHYDRNSHVHLLATRLVAFASKMIPSSIQAPPHKKPSTLKSLLASKSKYKKQCSYDNV